MSNGEVTAASAILIEADRVVLALDASSYRLAAVQKAGYRLAKRCTLLIGPVQASGMQISLLASAPLSEPEARAIALEFLRELGDQELRELIREETKGIRELILAHAFSNTDLVDRG